MSVSMMVQPSPPFVNAAGDPRAGLELSLVRSMLHSLGYPALVQVSSVSYLNESSVAEALGKFSHSAAELFLPSVTYASIVGQTERLSHTFPLVEDVVVFLVRQPKRQSLTANLLLTFNDPKVWLMLLALAAALWSLRWLGLGLGAARTAWYFVLGILLAVYANLLAISFNLRPMERPLFRDLDGLARLIESSQCRLVSLRSDQSDFAPLLEAGEDSWLPKDIKGRLRKAYQHNPPHFVDSEEGLVAALRESRCGIGLSFETSVMLYERRFCDLRVLTVPGLPRLHYYIAYKKKAVFEQSFRRLWLKGSAHELYQKTVQAYAENISVNLCLEDVTDFKVTWAPLKLQQVQDVFYLGGGCLLVALVGLLGEVAQRRWLGGARGDYLPLPLRLVHLPFLHLCL